MEVRNGQALVATDRASRSGSLIPCPRLRISHRTESSISDYTVGRQGTFYRQNSCCVSRMILGMEYRKVDSPDLQEVYISLHRSYSSSPRYMPLGFRGATHYSHTKHDTKSLEEVNYI